MNQPVPLAVTTASLIHQASVQTFLNGFEVLSGLIAKAEEAIAAGQLTEQEILDGRLAPDMLTFKGQIQRASDTSKGAAMRLGDKPIPSFDDNETDLNSLRERIAKTTEVIRSVSISDLEGVERRTISLPFGKEPVEFDAMSYLFEFAVPNFYFHVTTAYAILRHKGVKIGKLDYLLQAAKKRKA